MVPGVPFAQNHKPSWDRKAFPSLPWAVLSPGHHLPHSSREVPGPARAFVQCKECLLFVRKPPTPTPHATAVWIGFGQDLGQRNV